MVERHVEGVRVSGSNPFLGTNFPGRVAKSGERPPCKRKVVGSKPTRSTILIEPSGHPRGLFDPHGQLESGEAGNAPDC